MTQAVVSVEWLKENQRVDNLIILDASPKSTMSNKSTPHSGLGIPNARHFNIKENFTNVDSEFPNTVPTPSQFEEECQRLGINQNSVLVVYDNLGVHTSPRAWWLLKMMGHNDVRVLDGGLPEWIKKGGATEDVDEANQVYQRGDFKSHPHPELVISYEDVCENITSNSFLIVDARSQGRFEGKAEEPRKHLKSGCIPNSVNLPYQTLLEDGKFVSEDRIKEIFSNAVGDADKLAFSCGSGMTACIVMLASEIAYKESRFIYDGSWTEYAMKRNLLVE